MAEHIQQCDKHGKTLAGERCRFMESRYAMLSLDYMPARNGAVLPSNADYQQLADITGCLVCGVELLDKPSGVPIRPLRPRACITSDD